MNKKFSGYSIIEIASVIILICLIIAGSISSSKVVNFMSISNARESTSESSLNLMKSDVILWLDATSENSIDKKTSNKKTLVNNWYDSNSIDSTPISASQENDDLAPELVSNSLNSLPALNFDGLNDSMRISNLYQKTLSEKRNLGDNFSIFLIIKPNRESKTDGFILSHDGSRNDKFSNAATASISFNKNKISLFELSSQKNSEALSFESDFSRAVAVLIEYSSKEPRIFVNNKITKIGTKSSFEKILPPNFIGDVNQNNSFGGLVGEIIIINRSIDDAERLQVFSYLGKKWKIAIK